MSGNIDRRIVEMRFDNQDFEKNIGQTLISLETLQKALQMQQGEQGVQKVKKGIFGLGKAVDSVDTAGMAENVEQISNRFSTLGIIGTSILQTIGTHIAETGYKIKNLILAPLEEIKRGGLTRALNLEQANFQLKGLGIEKNDTASYYTEVMDAVLGTAYSYDVAAKAASQLAASDVGVIEKTKTLLNGQKATTKYMTGDMTKAILGIAGVAAMTGSSFEDISQVFTRVAGQGRLMSNDLNSISARGLNAAATLANYLGKTEKEVRDMVTKGEIDFDTFSAAMTEAFGSHAKDATQTFTGALEDVKAALSRIGADFYGPALTAARDVLNAMTPIVDLIHDKIQPGLDLAGKTMLIYSKKATGILDTITVAGNTLTDSLGNKLPPAMNIIQKGVASIKESTSGFEKGPINAFKILGDHLGITAKEAEKLAAQGKISFADWYDAMAKFSLSGKKGANEVKAYLADMGAELRRYENIADNLGLTQDKMTMAFERFAKVMDVDVAKVYEAIGEKLGKTGDEMEKAVKKGEVSLTDFRGALNELLKDGAITDEQFHAVMVDIDSMILPLDQLQGAINKFGTHFGAYFTDILTAGKDVLKLFRDAFKGLIDVISGGGSESALFALVKNLLAFVAAISRGISKLIEFGRESGIFKRIHDFLLDVNYAAFGAIESLSAWASSLEFDFTSITESLGRLLTPLLNIIKAITSFVTGNASKGIGLLTSGFEKLVGTISNGLSYLTKGFNVFKALGPILTTAFGVKLLGQMSMFSALITEIANQFRKYGSVGVGNLFKQFFQTGVGPSTVAAVNDGLWKLRDTLLAYQTVIKVRSLSLIAASILELAIAVKLLSDIPAGRLLTSVGAIEVLMKILVVASNSMAAAQTQGIIKISIAIRILAGAVKTLSDLSAGDVIKGVLAIGALMQMLVKMNTYMSVMQGGSAGKAAGTLLLYALALRMMVKPVKQIGQMNIQDIAKGIASVAIMLQLLSKTAYSFSEFKSGELFKAAAAMILFGIAINELVVPILLLGHMNVKGLGKGLGAITVVLIELGLFTKAMTGLSYMGPEMMILGAAMVGLGKALVIISGAIAIMGNTANVGTGLSVLFSSLLILGLAMRGMQGALPGAAAMIIVAGALAIMVPPLVLLSSLNFGGVITGLVGLAGAIAIFGAAAFVLSAAWAFFLPGIAILTALSAAIALTGVGVLALGTGMGLLASAFKAGTDSIIEGLTALAAMLPTITGYLWDFIKGMLAGFISSLPLIIDTLTAIIDAALIAMGSNVPKFVAVGIYLLKTLLEALRANIGEITQLAIDIIVNFVNALSSREEVLADAGFNFLISFFNGTANAIAQNGPVLIDSINNLILSVIEVIVGAIPFFGDYAADAINKYRQGLEGGKKDVKSAADGVASASKIKASDQSKEGRKGATTFAKGEASGKKDVRAAAKANEDAGNMKIKDQHANGANATRGLINGLGSLLPSLRSKANEIASVVDKAIKKKNQIKSPAKVTTKDGRFIMMGLINGLDSLMGEYKKKADNIATIMITSTGKAIDAMGSFNAMNLSGAISQSSDVNLRMSDIQRENDKLANGIDSLTKQLDSMTESMNSRALNNYITIDGAGDPEAFADGLINSFRLNARTV